MSSISIYSRNQSYSETQLLLKIHKKMKTWGVVLLVICVPIYLFVWGGAISEYIQCRRKGYNYHLDWEDVLYLIFPPFGVLNLAFGLIWHDVYDYIKEVEAHGGLRKHKEWKKQEAIEAARREAERKAKKQEYERIKALYKKGELARTELPRIEDGVSSFEFKPEMNLYADFFSKVREIIYVENERSERLNKFFLEHPGLRLYHKYRFIYLPNLSKELENDKLLHYLVPSLKPNEKVDISLESNYPIQFLEYQEDAKNIKQGMFFFLDEGNNHGAKYIRGDYHPLCEGSDEEIIAQLDDIVKKVHAKHNNAALYSIAQKPDLKEGKTKDYADRLFNWVAADDEIAGLMEDVRKKIEALRERGVAERVLLSLLERKPQLSRLVVTQDFRILLPDYNDMEIKMEPLVKAVYLLFLKHPEGILFKYLPDYREELTSIYVKLKPYGMSLKVMQSIEDVTNPLLNSINEKCARIRGAFVSQFDERLAEHYYVDGHRGKAKSISLSRDLVVWE